MTGRNFFAWLHDRRMTPTPTEDADWREEDHPRGVAGGGHGGEFTKKPETLRKEDSRDNLSRSESAESSSGTSSKEEDIGKFKVGGVHDVWSPCPHGELYNKWQIVEISDDRKSALIIDADNSSQEEAPAKRVGIVNDPRFGEKIVMRKEGWPFVIRADKRTEVRDAPKYYDAAAKEKEEKKKAASGKAKETREYKKFFSQMVEKCDTVEKFSKLCASVYNWTEAERKSHCDKWNARNAKVLSNQSVLGKGEMYLILGMDGGSATLEIPKNSDREALLALLT